MAAYMIKRTATAAHIAGLTTSAGREIHSITGDAETGATYGELQDAVNEINATALPFCRTCRVASELILNRR
jgi:hypothetical protein